MPAITRSSAQAAAAAANGLNAKPLHSMSQSSSSTTQHQSQQQPKVQSSSRKTSRQQQQQQQRPSLPTRLVNLNDSAILAVCQGKEEHALDILQRAKYLLSNNFEDRPENGYNITTVTAKNSNNNSNNSYHHRAPGSSREIEAPVAVSISIPTYSQIHQQNSNNNNNNGGAAFNDNEHNNNNNIFNANEMAFKRTPNSPFHFFDYMFAVAMQQDNNNNKYYTRGRLFLPKQLR